MLGLFPNILMFHPRFTFGSFPDPFERRIGFDMPELAERPLPGLLRDELRSKFRRVLTPPRLGRDAVGPDTSRVPRDVHWPLDEVPPILSRRPEPPTFDDEPIVFDVWKPLDGFGWPVLSPRGLGALPDVPAGQVPTSELSTPTEVSPD